MLMCEQSSERVEGGVRAAHVNATDAPTPRAGTYSRSSLHREEWKIYIKPSEKSTTHPEGGGVRTCVRFKRAVAAPAAVELNFIIEQYHPVNACWRNRAALHTYCTHYPIYR